jgi:glycosyltransferase involved in cell wall biosynthesis
VSVIIPCFNQGAYVDEAVQSVLAQSCQDFEIIIINDGSTDVATNDILRIYDRPKTRVFHIANQGLAGARNQGVKEASGKYILTLDADDKIGNTYLEKAVEILDEHENVGIVYCEAEFFGDVSDRWDLPEYKFPDILLRNAIFSAGFFRKSDWIAVGGYSSNVPGREDYDFWLSIIELGRDVLRIPEVLFFYRRHNASMSASWNREQVINAFAQLYRNHTQLYSDNIHLIFERMYDLEAAVTLTNKSRVWRLRNRLVDLKSKLIG